MIDMSSGRQTIEGWIVGEKRQRWNEGEEDGVLEGAHRIAEWSHQKGHDLRNLPSLGVTIIAPWANAQKTI